MYIYKILGFGLQSRQAAQSWFILERWAASSEMRKLISPCGYASLLSGLWRKSLLGADIALFVGNHVGLGWGAENMDFWL